MLTNSALDPYEGGVVTDRSRRMLTIERNVSYDAYDPLLTQEFEETINAKPYKLGLLRRTVYTTDPAYPIAAADPERAPVLGPTGATIGYSVPLRVPPGMARLTELTGWRRTLARGPYVSQTAFYWQIQVQIEIDRSVFTDEHGQEQPTRWRKVLADVGPHFLNEKGQQTAALVRGGVASASVLLDGAGRRIGLTGTGVAQLPPPAEAARTVADAGAGMGPVDRARVPWPRHLWFGAIEDTDMSVTAEKGLFIADGRRVATGVTVSTDPEHGAVELDGTAGGFTYTPDDGYVGWDRFGFRLSGPAGTSDEAFAIIKIGPRPRVRVFDVDYEKDWDPIAPLIGGW